MKPPRGPTVLVLDPEGALAELRRWLGPEPRLRAAPDARRALAMARRAPPGLLLATIGAAAEDGFGLLRAFRANLATCGVPIVLASSAPPGELLVAAFEAGADDCLSLPLDGADVTARVALRLRRPRYRERQDRLLQATQDVARSVVAGREPAQIFRIVAAHAAALAGADGAHVAVLHPGGGQYTIVAATGLGRVLEGQTFQAGDGLAGFVFTPVRSPHRRAQGHARLERAVGMPVGAVLGIPIQARGERLGALVVWRGAGGAGFDAEAQRLLRLVGSQVAIAIEDDRARQNRLRVAVMEEERVRIAHDIHDDTMQTLGAMLLRLGRLREDLTEAAERDAVDRMVRLAQHTSDRLRTLVFQLRADLLDQGLSAAIELVTRDQAVQAGIDHKVDVELEAEPRMDVAVTLYRVAQEALTNVRKHARAGRVEVSLTGDAEVVCLRVIDDGVGFDSGADDQGRRQFGMRSMAERCRLVGGQVTVSSAPGRGCLVEARVPVRDPGPAALAGEGATVRI